LNPICRIVQTELKKNMNCVNEISYSVFKKQPGKKSDIILISESEMCVQWGCRNKCVYNVHCNIINLGVSL